MLKSTPSQKQDSQVPQHPSIVDLSPFMDGPKWEPATLLPAAGVPGTALASVVSISEAVDEDGAPLRATIHLVGRHCLHWAPDGATTGDCRFGCVKLRKVPA